MGNELFEKLINLLLNVVVGKQGKKKGGWGKEFLGKKFGFRLMLPTLENRIYVVSLFKIKELRVLIFRLMGLTKQENIGRNRYCFVR